MTRPFEVVPAAVSDTGKFVQDTAQTLISAVRSTNTEVQGLTSTWKGTAASAYAHGWEEVRQGAVEALEALKTMAAALEVTARGFDALDHQHAEAQSRITSSLNL